MKAVLNVTIDVPDSSDLCWSPDGVQAFYDSVLKPAFASVLRNYVLAGAGKIDLSIKPEVLQAHYRNHLHVARSVEVNGVKMFDGDPDDPV